MLLMVDLLIKSTILRDVMLVIWAALSQSNSFFRGVSGGDAFFDNLGVVEGTWCLDLIPTLEVVVHLLLLVFLDLFKSIITSLSLSSQRKEPI